MTFVIGYGVVTIVVILNVSWILIIDENKILDLWLNKSLLDSLKWELSICF